MTVRDSWTLDALVESYEQHLLQSGVDLTVIALWLGHEDTATTHMYIEADLAMKEAALRRLEDPAPRTLRFQARDRLLAFLEAL
jgi:site-specific recombinase XerD